MTDLTNTVKTTDRADVTDTASRDKRGASSIRMQGLRKQFGRDSVALAGVDLDINAGEFFTLLGHPGVARRPCCAFSPAWKRPMTAN